MSTQNSGKGLLTEMCNLMRHLHYSIHTERAYCDRVARFIRFHQMDDAGGAFCQYGKNVEDFLTHLAVQTNVAISTQSHAFNALVFLYKRALQ